MSHFQRHVFFCCNQREAPDNCCNNRAAEELHAYAKNRVKALGLAGKGQVRINRAGCLDRSDIDEIIDRHVVGGEIVERLRI